jgi:hypothetical protein
LLSVWCLTFLQLSGLARPTTITAGAWGAQSGKFGAVLSDDAEPIGPSCLALAADGTVLVGDWLNGRVQQYSAEGKRLSTFRLAGGEAFIMLAAAPTPGRTPTLLVSNGVDRFGLVRGRSTRWLPRLTGDLAVPEGVIRRLAIDARGRYVTEWRVGIREGVRTLVCDADLQKGSALSIGQIVLTPGGDILYGVTASTHAEGKWTLTVQTLDVRQEYAPAADPLTLQLAAPAGALVELLGVDEQGGLYVLVLQQACAANRQCRLCRFTPTGQSDGELNLTEVMEHNICAPKNPLQSIRITPQGEAIVAVGKPREGYYLQRYPREDFVR